MMGTDRTKSHKYNKDGGRLRVLPCAFGGGGKPAEKSRQRRSTITQDFNPRPKVMQNAPETKVAKNAKGNNRLSPSC